MKRFGIILKQWRRIAKGEHSSPCCLTCELQVDRTCRRVARRCRLRFVAAMMMMIALVVVFLSNATHQIKSVHPLTHTSSRDKPSDVVTPLLPSDAQSPCYPYHGVVSRAASPHPIVYCTHEPNVSDVFISSALGSHGYWPDCLDVMLLLLLVSSQQDRASTNEREGRRLFVDVGANIGACSALVAAHIIQKPAAANNTTQIFFEVDHVVSVEPLLANMRILNATVRANKDYHSLITAVRAALLSDDGTSLDDGGHAAPRFVKLSTSPGNFGNASVAAQANAPASLRSVESSAHQDDEFIAPVTTLDRVVADFGTNSRITLLKVDIQGSEFACLRGAESLFTRSRVSLVMLEIEPHQPQPSLSYKNAYDSLRFLFRHNFRVFCRAVHRIELINATIGPTFIARGFWEKKVFQELFVSGVGDFVDQRLHDVNGRTLHESQRFMGDVVAVSSHTANAWEATNPIAERLNELNYKIIKKLRHQE